MVARIGVRALERVAFPSLTSFEVAAHIAAAEAALALIGAATFASFCMAASAEQQPSMDARATGLGASVGVGATASGVGAAAAAESTAGAALAAGASSTACTGATAEGSGTACGSSSSFLQPATKSAPTTNERTKDARTQVDMPHVYP